MRIDEGSLSPAKGPPLEVEGASPTLVSVESGAGGLKVGTGVPTTGSVDVSRFVGGNMLGGPTTLLLVSAQQSSNTLSL